MSAKRSRKIVLPGKKLPDTIDAEAVLAELRERHPLILREILFPPEPTPKLPGKKLEELRQRATELATPQTVTAVLVKGVLLIQTEIFMNDATVDFEELSIVLEDGVPKAKLQTLFTDYVLGGEFDEDRGRDVIYDSKAYQALYKKVQKLFDEVEALQDRYDFDYCEEIGIYGPGDL